MGGQRRKFRSSFSLASETIIYYDEGSEVRGAGATPNLVGDLGKCLSYSKPQSPTYKLGMMNPTSEGIGRTK